MTVALEQMLDRLQDLYRLAELTTSESQTEDGTQGRLLPALRAAVDPTALTALTEALAEVLYECRGAIDYGGADTPVSRLATRIAEALQPVLA